MRKILYVTNITRNVNSFFIPHINMLINEGYEVGCACKINGEHKLKSNKLKKKIKFFDIPVTRNPMNFKNLIAFVKLYKIQKKYNYDIIHVHSPIIGIYTRLLKVFYPDIKMIYTVHGYHFHKNSSKLSWLIFYNIEKFASRFTDILITINDEDFEISKKFKQNKLLKINGVGVDLDDFKIINSKEQIVKIRRSIGLQEDDFVLIMVGEHNNNKNQMQLIKSIELLEGDYPKIKALFIGDGVDINKNVNYIRDKKINNCIILGFRDDVSELINASDVLVSLSYREGLPKNVIEGLTLGKPIIGTRTRGTEDLVNKNGYLVNSNNIKQTIESIKKLYFKSDKEFKLLSNESIKIAKNYELNSVLRELKKLY